MIDQLPTVSNMVTNGQGMRLQDKYKVQLEQCGAWGVHVAFINIKVFCPPVGNGFLNNSHTEMDRNRVLYSVVYFDHFIAFEALKHRMSVKGGTHTFCIDA